MKIVIPENLQEICLSQYQKYIKIFNDVGECEFLNQKAIEIFCNVKLSHVLHIKSTSVDEIVSHINGLFGINHKHIERFTLESNGTEIEFGFIPDLEEMTYGEYVDIETSLADWDTMHKAMSVMYRPIERISKDKYRVKEYTGEDEYSELMKFAPVEAALGAVVFFYLLGSELVKAIPSYLEEELEAIHSAKKGNSKELGDGITASILLLRGTLGDLMKSQPYPLSNAYSS